MRFLLPVGGIVDHRFGILTAPNHTGVPIGIQKGMDWAGDIGCLDGPSFVKRIDLDATYRWLTDEMSPYWWQCLFIAGSDMVGGAKRTLEAFEQFSIRLGGWPLAYCAQDGQEDLPFPSQAWEVLFVGGTTEWKLSEACYSVIQRAQALGKRIHIGRVNWWKRYAHFRAMPGSEDWTCDGTRTRFNGTRRTVAAWADYMERFYQARFSLPLSDSGR